MEEGACVYRNRKFRHWRLIRKKIHVRVQDGSSWNPKCTWIEVLKVHLYNSSQFKLWFCRKVIMKVEKHGFLLSTRSRMKHWTIRGLDCTPEVNPDEIEVWQKFSWQSVCDFWWVLKERIPSNSDGIFQIWWRLYNREKYQTNWAETDMICANKRV